MGQKFLPLLNAISTYYNNRLSTLRASNVNDAIDELDHKKARLTGHDQINFLVDDGYLDDHAVNFRQLHVALGDYDDTFSAPAIDGQALVSTIAGVRSWASKADEIGNENISFKVGNAGGTYGPFDAIRYQDAVALIDTQHNINGNFDEVFKVAAWYESNDPNVTAPTQYDAINWGQYEPHIAGTGDKHDLDTINFDDTNINSGALHSQGLIEFLDDQIGIRETAATGVIEFSGGIIQDTITDITVTAGEGEIVDGYTDRRAPTRRNIKWLARPIDLLFDNAGGSWFTKTFGILTVYVQPNNADLNKSNVLILDGIILPSAKRTNVILAFIFYRNNVIDYILHSPILSNEVGNTLYDYITYKPYEDRIKGLATLAILNPPALSVYIEDGEIFVPGSNAFIGGSGSPVNPNVLQLIGEGEDITPVSASFDIMFADGQTHLANQTIFPEYYEDLNNPNVIVNLTGNDAAIHYLFRTIGGNLILQLGQLPPNGEIYTTAKEARDSLEIDEGYYTKFLDSETTIFLAQIYLGNNAPDFTDTNKAGIANKLGGNSGSNNGGIPVTDFLALQDVFPDTYIGQARKTISVNDIGSGNGDSLVFTDDPVRWRAAWKAGLYLANDMVRDGAWGMIANKDTVDRAAPEALGTPQFTLPDAPAWNTASYTGQIQQELRVSGLIENYQITQYRVWVYSLAANVTYRVLSRDNITNAIQALASFSGNDVANIGWLEITADAVFIQPGEDKSIILLTQDIASETFITQDYIYVDRDRDPDDTDPGSGNFTYQRDNLVTRFSLTDRNGLDKTVELDTITVGSTIRITDDGTPTQWLEFEIIEAPIKYATYYTFQSILVNEGPDGRLDQGLPATVLWTTVTAAATSYVVEPDSYINTISLESTLITDITVVSNDGMGIDFNYQRYDASPDWDLLGYFSSSSSSGGGGGTTEFFTQLLDTPVNYTGSAGQVVTVRADEQGLEFIPATGGSPTFVGLTDTPNNYTGAANNLVVVNATANALEYIPNNIITDHTFLSSIGNYVHTDIDNHIDNIATHFTEATINHSNILGSGNYTHLSIDQHIDNTSIHLQESVINHNNILNVGSYSHADLDNHLVASSVHFTVGSISHTLIADIGVLTHLEIDAHVADTNNPHGVTAADVNAVAKTGDTMSGNLALSESNTNFYIGNDLNNYPGMYSDYSDISLGLLNDQRLYLNYTNGAGVDIGSLTNYQACEFHMASVNFHATNLSNALQIDIDGNVSIANTPVNSNHVVHKGYADTKEPALNNPATDGEVLSSTAAGIRSWTPITGGGVTAHGDLTGLDADDHPQYVKTSGDTMTGQLTVRNDGMGVSVRAVNSDATFTGYAIGDTSGTLRLSLAKNFVADTTAITNRDALGGILSGFILDPNGDVRHLVEPPMSNISSIPDRAYVDDGRFAVAATYSGDIDLLQSQVGTYSLGAGAFSTIDPTLNVAYASLTVFKAWSGQHFQLLALANNNGLYYRNSSDAFTTVFYKVADTGYVDDADNLKINKSGDIMTGDLTIQKVTPKILLETTENFTAPIIEFANSAANLDNRYALRAVSSLSDGIAGISIERNGTSFVVFGEEQTTFDGVLKIPDIGSIVPAEGSHATNKLYVDSKVIGKNYIINPTFNINQREFAGGAVAINEYINDRWKAGHGTAADVTFSNGVATITSGVLQQPVELIPELVGKVMTISWEGTSEVNLPRVSGDITTFYSSPHTFVVVGDVAVIDYFSFNVGTVSNVKLEMGDTQTPFEYPDVGTELTKCQRYYEKGNVQFRSFSTSAGALFYYNSLLIVNKRVTPLVTTEITANSIWSINAVDRSSISTLVIEYIADNASATGYCYTNFIADAEL